MTFPQRVANTLIAFAFTKVRDLYVYPKLEKVIDDKFPNEVRPSLKELENNAGLALQVGHLETLLALSSLIPYKNVVSKKPHELGSKNLLSVHTLKRFKL